MPIFKLAGKPETNSIIYYTGADWELHCGGCDLFTVKSDSMIPPEQGWKRKDAGRFTQIPKFQ